MRCVRYSAAMCLDGFIAGPKGENHWIVMDRGIHLATMMTSFDTILNGQGTYEAAREAGGGGVGLCRSLIDLGRVNAIKVSLIPVVHGADSPLSPEGKRHKLKLEKRRVYAKTGTLGLEYLVSR